jgi:transcriptional regulator with XRE-family HTH domain
MPVPGASLRTIRKSLGVTNAALAKALGTSHSAVTDLEARENVSDATATRYSETAIAVAQSGLARAAVLKAQLALVAKDVADAALSSDVLKGRHETTAQAIAKAEGITIAKARAAAWSRNPQLARQYLNSSAREVS